MAFFRRMTAIGGLVATLTFSGCSKDPASPEEPTPIPENNTPRIERILKSTDLIGTGESVTFTCEATDKDGDNLTYEWEYNFGTSERFRNQLYWTAPSRDRIDKTHHFDVTVKDVHGDSDTERVSLPVYTKLRQFYPIKDALVSTQCPDENMFDSCNVDFFTPYFLTIGSSNSFLPEYRSYLAFDLTSINFQGIEEAKLSLAAIDGGGHSPGNLESEVGFVTSNWFETTITWNSQPSYELRGSYFSIPLETSFPFQSVDLTDYVTSWVQNPITNHGFVLMPQSWENGIRQSRTFASTRANEHFELGETDPKLEVWLE